MLAYEIGYSIGSTTSPDQLMRGKIGDEEYDDDDDDDDNADDGELR